jgi:hypothetical protein
MFENPGDPKPSFLAIFNGKETSKEGQTGMEFEVLKQLGPEVAHKAWDSLPKGLALLYTPSRHTCCTVSPALMIPSGVLYQFINGVEENSLSTLLKQLAKDRKEAAGHAALGFVVDPSKPKS